MKVAVLIVENNNHMKNSDEEMFWKVEH